MRFVVSLSLLLLPALVASFSLSSSISFGSRRTLNGWGAASVGCDGSKDSNDLEVFVNTQLDDEKVASLFAWVSLAFRGIDEYNNLMLAIAAIFGNLPPTSVPVQMAERARKLLPLEEEPVGDKFTIEEREYNSLGAMGAAQWTGRFKTRPHALLELKNITTVDDWVASLPRGCRRTIKRALDQNITVTTKHIEGGKPAPHSSLAHFRCVVAHEVRLLSNMYGKEAFFDALAEAVSRYIGTTRMTGDIREYRNATTNKVIAIAHEVRKGKTIRGQWFYADDEAAKNYVWFHSVYSLIERALEADGVTCVDLGPSGSDAFSELKARYGFASYDDWTDVADYGGDFWYCGKPRKGSAIDRPRFGWF
ncbi:hypothetical protein IV203_006262 [Nitzschia inconspicua]|uniref:Uncharacterized protein n=1 Tax=Nitzschia inconspicua TaxID=303405 RepID=A0A9K3KQC1_9STRA|nr:hypothetical protein IV203_006262 [Nitzschia inconspicua]